MKWDRRVVVVVDGLVEKGRETGRGRRRLRSTEREIQLSLSDSASAREPSHPRRLSSRARDEALRRRSCHILRSDAYGGCHSIWIRLRIALVVFPRVSQLASGTFSHPFVWCFPSTATLSTRACTAPSRACCPLSEMTWTRLAAVGILHTAVEAALARLEERMIHGLRTPRAIVPLTPTASVLAPLWSSTGVRAKSGDHGRRSEMARTP
ncbi:hypothetical protein FB451DRAFT_643389 [Mycena latifolia]|nr:hypothetical protein FB451DRAFT_643389 [Mycena latifolia]